MQYRAKLDGALGEVEAGIHGIGMRSFSDYAQHSLTCLAEEGGGLRCWPRNAVNLIFLSDAPSPAEVS